MKRFLLVPLALAAGCNYTGAWLFSNPTEIPGVLDLGQIIPSDVASQADIDDAAIYREVGATGTSEPGGVTFSFVGTGGPVCVFMDPELAFWNQSVALTGPQPEYTYPDNFFDDGDLDLFAGFSVYYTGSPGERIGAFKIQYEDSLGNPIPIELNECTIASMRASEGGHGGRGAPESCTMAATQPGVSYTVLMQTFATPLDDDRLGFGLLVTNGTCRDMVRASNSPDVDECILLGEGIDPTTTVVADNGDITTGTPYPGSDEFQAAYCGSVGGGTTDLADYCTQEAIDKDCLDPAVHCFCGDPADSPGGELH